MKDELKTTIDNKLTKVEDGIIIIREQQVMIDSDVADLYGVETRRINEAVKNNPEKFPEGYIISLTKSEFKVLRSKFSTAKWSKRRTLPNVFPEKGLYMLATILKSRDAIDATFAIIETFSKLRELARTMERLNDIDIPDKEAKTLKERSGKLFKEILKDPLPVKMRKTTLSFNFGVVKISVETTFEKEK